MPQTNLESNVVASFDKPINGGDLSALIMTLEQIDPFTGQRRSITLNDLGFLLNVPPQYMPTLKSAPSSLYSKDRRFVEPSLRDQLDLADEEADIDQSEEGGAKSSSADQPSIRPNTAILVRLFMAHPEYACLLPPAPSSQEVYDLIQPLMRPPGEPLNAPGDSKRRWFAQLFGRSLVNSYKMLPVDEDASAQIETRRSIRQIQTLIMARMAMEFRELLDHYRINHMPKEEWDNPIYQPTSRSWDILRERDSLTDWMNAELFERFEATLYDRFRRWWDERYMETLIEEAQSRRRDYQDAIIKGNWSPKKRANHEGADKSLALDAQMLDGYRKMTRMHQISFAEAIWAIGLGPKNFFHHRTRTDKRMDAATSILVRHLMKFPEELNLLIPETGNTQEITRHLATVDNRFRPNQIGPLLGGGLTVGKLVAEGNPNLPTMTRRGLSVLAHHLRYSDDIYWHLRDAAAKEAHARGLDFDEVMRTGVWHKVLRAKDIENLSHDDSPNNRKGSNSPGAAPLMPTTGGIPASSKPVKARISYKNKG